MHFSVRPIHTTPWYGDHLRVSGALTVIYKKYFDDSPEDIPKSKEGLERFLTEELGMPDQLAHHERTYIFRYPGKRTGYNRRERSDRSE